LGKRKTIKVTKKLLLVTIETHMDTELIKARFKIRRQKKKSEKKTHIKNLRAIRLRAIPIISSSKCNNNPLKKKMMCLSKYSRTQSTCYLIFINF